MTNNKEISTRIKRLIQIVQEIKTNPSQTPEQVYQKFSISKAQFYKDKKSCLSLSERGVRMFRINRINAIRMTGEKFTRDSSYDFTQRHKNAFSVFAGDKTEKVVVRFNKAVETYIQETLWHNSQSISTTKNGILFTVHVAEPKEVLWWALGWGASAEIIEPHWLRQMARDEIKQMLKKYK